MKTFKYNVTYTVNENVTIAKINISETLKIILKEFGKEIQAYQTLTGQKLFNKKEFVGIAKLKNGDTSNPEVGRNFALFKARRKGKEYLEKDFKKMCEAFISSTNIARTNWFDYNAVKFEEDAQIKKLCKKVDNKDNKTGAKPLNAEIFIYQENRRYKIENGKININGMLFPSYFYFSTKQDVIDYFSGKRGECGSFSYQKVDFAFLDRV